MRKFALTKRNGVLALLAVSVALVLAGWQYRSTYASLPQEISSQIEAVMQIEKVELKAVTTRTPACLISFSANRRSAPWRAAFASGRKYMDVWLLTTSRIRPLVAQRMYRCLLSLPLP